MIALVVVVAAFVVFQAVRPDAVDCDALKAEREAIRDESDPEDFWVGVAMTSLNRRYREVMETGARECDGWGVDFQAECQLATPSPGPCYAPTAND